MFGHALEAVVTRAEQDDMHFVCSSTLLCVLHATYGKTALFNVAQQKHCTGYLPKLSMRD